MLLFAWPMMLGFAGVVGVAGLWALWRGMRGVEKVSSTKLWEGLVEMAAGGKSRKVDPIWLMVLVGAVLAGVGLAGPVWRSGGEDGPVAKVEWAVRSIGEGEPELFARVSDAKELNGALEVDYQYVSQVDEEFPGEAGKRYVSEGEGVTIALGRGSSSAPMVAVRVRVHKLSGYEEVLEEARFQKPARPPFGLLTETGKGRGIDPAVYRVFSVNAGARVGDATIEPRVLLVNDLGFDAGTVGGGTLVVRMGGTPMPGVKLTGEFKPVNGVPMGVNVPGFVRLEKVEVREAEGAELSKEWEVAATVDGRPWVATRKLGGMTLVWLGSMPATESNWGLDTSFPIYFADLMARTFPGREGAAVIDWTREDLAVRRAKGSETRLAGMLGMVAILLLVGASGLLLRRGRG